MDEEVRDFLSEVKALIPNGDIPEYVFKMVEIISDAKKAIDDAWERSHLAEVTIEQDKETIERLQNENARLRDVNIKALLNQSSEQEKPSDNEDNSDSDKDKIKTLNEVLEEGVD